MKKVLVFIDWYLPGYKAGGPIRSMANMIHSLKTEYCFYVVCLDTDYLETVPYQNIKYGAWNKLSENEYVYYISKKALSYRLLKKIIKSENFDVAYINGVYSLYFSIIPILLAKLSKIRKIIVAPRGMYSKQTFSAKNTKKKFFIAITRFFGFYKNTILHVTSVSEKSDIQLLKFKPLQIEMLPNLPPIIIHNFKEREKVPGELKLVNIARISPEKNTLFALQCLANHNYNGRIIYNLYGPVYNKSYWKQCLEIISQLPSTIEVVYHGEIDNNEVISILQNHHFLFLPSQGENFGHSILEAFIAGCPAIISNTTPWKNLEIHQLGWDLDLKTELFGSVIQKALDLDNENYQTLSQSCKDFTKENIDNSKLRDEYIKLIG